MAKLRQGFHVTTKKNWNKIKHEGLKPKIGKLSGKIETEDGIYLFVSEEEAENALMNWLGDEMEEAYGDDVELVLLRVDLRRFNKSIHKDENGQDFFEQVINEPIPPECIEFVKEV